MQQAQLLADDSLSEGEWTGRCLGGYRVGPLLGTGSAAAVYEVTHRNGDVMAMKILRACWQGRQVAIQRFERETCATALVRHPRVVRIFEDGFERDGTRWQVFERLRGRDLSSVLFERTLSVVETRALAHQLLQALGAVHEQGLVHRDIKPENIFVLDEPGGISVKLLDFGIAKGMNQPNLTDPGMVVGTPHYMAPEQITGERPVTPSSDLWSLGAVLFHSLTGRPPFDSDNIGELLSRVASEPAPRITSRRPDLPPGLCRVIDRALEFLPSQRFRSADEMLTVL